VTPPAFPAAAPASAASAADLSEGKLGASNNDVTRKPAGQTESPFQQSAQEPGTPVTPSSSAAGPGMPGAGRPRASKARRIAACLATFLFSGVEHVIFYA
jgi:hypothetical protein